MSKSHLHRQNIISSFVCMARLFYQQALHTAVFIPIIAKGNVRILPGHTGIISAVLKTGKSTFTPRNTIISKGIAYVRPFDKTLPL